MMVVVVLLLAVVTALADATGFLNASRIWDGGRLVVPAMLKSGAGFGVGVVSYWALLRHAQRYGIVEPELQTLGWFVITIVGVAILSGAFFRWRPLRQGVALATLVGLGWLLVSEEGS